MLLVFGLGSNLYVQRHENISRNLINSVSQSDPNESSLFLRYTVQNDRFWQPDLYMPNTDMLYKFQKDFKPTEVLTTGYYAPTEKSVPLLLSNNQSGQKYSAIVSSSVSQLGFEIIAGENNDSLLMHNIISISTTTADYLLGLPENLGKTYGDLINTSITAYSFLNNIYYENSYKISSVFSMNFSSQQYEKFLDNKFIVVSNTTSLPGAYGFNFEIEDISVPTLQRLLTYIEKYLGVDQFYYDVDALQTTTLKAFIVYNTTVVELSSFDSLVTYYKSKNSVFVSVIMIILLFLFLWNLRASVSSINNGHHSPKSLYITLTISFTLSLLLMSFLRTINLGFASLYLLNYYSFIFTTLFYFVELIYINLIFKKSSKKLVDTNPKKHKITIIQQVPNLNQSSGLTKDFNNMNESSFLSERYNFVVVTSSKKGILARIIDYYRQISNIDSDLIIIRGAGPESLWPSIAAKLANKKIILAVHGMWSDLRYLGKLKRWISKNIIEYSLFSICDTFYTVYEGAISKDKIKQFRDKYYGCIYNPITKHDNTNQPLPIDNSIFDDKSINGLFVGRITKEKGINFLIDALSKLYDSEEFSNFKMYFIGDGPDLNHFKNTVESLKLSEKVFFLGEKNELGEYYKNADIFVFPSLHENFPNAILEAINHNLFILSTNVGGIPEILNNGDGCLLVSPESADDLLNGLKAIITEQRFKVVNHSLYHNKKELFSKSTFENEIDKLIETSIYESPNNKLLKENTDE